MTDKDLTIASTEHDDDWWRSSLKGSDHFHLNRVRRKSIGDLGIIPHKHSWGECKDPHCIYSRPRPVTVQETRSPAKASGQENNRAGKDGGAASVSKVVPKDPALKQANQDKGGGGANLTPMWRKRDYPGKGGLVYHHEVLLSTSTKQQLASSGGAA